MYTFTFWGCYDQLYIDKLCNQFCLFGGDILEDLENMGYDYKQITSSPNPVIYGIFNQLTNELIEELEQYDLSDELLTKVREFIENNIELNSCCSSLPASLCFETLENEIIKDLKSYDNQIFNQKLIDQVKSIFDKFDC